MVRSLVIILLFLGVLSPLYSQEKMQFLTGIGMKYKLMENSEEVYRGFHGAALEFGVRYKTKYPFSVAGSMEVGAGGVSNYVGLNAGVEKSFSLGKGNFEITPGIHVIQALALTRPKALYMWGLEQKNFLAYRFEKGSALGLVIGLRLYAFPGYSVYSSVYRFLDLNLGIGFRF